MNWDEIEGNWDQLKGKVKSQWAKFTDDDLLAISGKKDELIGKLKVRYGYEKEQAKKEIDNFLMSCGSCSSTSHSARQ